MPDVIFLYRVNEIFEKTLKKIKKKYPYIQIVTYHNDNPYADLRRRVKYRNFLGCVNQSDIAYAYRPSDLKNLERYKAKKNLILRPYYYSKKDLVDCVPLKKKDDVVFIGHYEDNRAQSINRLIKKGVRVRIYGDLNQWEVAM